MDVEVIAQHDEDVTVEPGALKLFVFGKLKNSARKESTDSPVIAKFLNTEASYCRNASDCSVSALICPYVYCGDATYRVGSNHLVSDFLKPGVPPAGLRFGL